MMRGCSHIKCKFEGGEGLYRFLANEATDEAQHP